MDILHKRKACERKVVFSRNEDFHTKGTFYHIIIFYQGVLPVPP